MMKNSCSAENHISCLTFKYILRDCEMGLFSLSLMLWATCLGYWQCNIVEKEVLLNSASRRDFFMVSHSSRDDLLMIISPDERETTKQAHWDESLVSWLFSSQNMRHPTSMYRALSKREPRHRILQYNFVYLWERVT